MDPERSTALMAEASPEGPAGSALQRTLRQVLDDSIGVDGALVATTEGLLVAAEFARRHS
jgi:hypothetical protein